MNGAAPALHIRRICFHVVVREMFIFLPYLPKSSVLKMEITTCPKHLYVSKKTHSIMSLETGIWICWLCILNLYFFVFIKQI